MIRAGRFRISTFVNQFWELVSFRKYPPLVCACRAFPVILECEHVIVIPTPRCQKSSDRYEEIVENRLQML